MDKLKKIFQRDWQNVKILYSKETKTIFLVTIITSIIVHFQLYALMITGPDTLINSMYHQADIWETMLLRFGLNFIQVIKGNIVSPALSTLLSSIFLGVTVVLVIDILEIKKKYLKYIVAIIFAVAPNISATLTFFYCSDAYILGMLLATLSVFLIRKYKDNNWIILISGLLVGLSMGMYQTYLSIAMVLCISSLIIDLLNKEEKKQIFINIFRYILMGLIGIILYYTLSHITLSIKNLHVSNYSGANSIGVQTLLDFPKLLPEAYESFFAYFFNDKMIPNTIWNTDILYTVIFITMIISTIYIILKNELYKKITNIIILLIFVFVAPICFSIIEIIVPSVDIHILMACSMIYIFPLFFKILEILPKNIITNLFKYIVMICSVIIIWNYVWQDNASYIAIKSMQNQTESTVLRLVTHIEQLDEYNPQMSILIVGGLENNSYFNKNNTTIEAKKIYDRTWKFISNTSTIWCGNLDCWKKMLYEYIGVNVNLVSEGESSKILETDEFKNMKSYPEKDSIKVINNIVVIKLSN